MTMLRFKQGEIDRDIEIRDSPDAPLFFEFEGNKVELTTDVALAGPSPRWKCVKGVTAYIREIFPTTVTATLNFSPDVGAGVASNPTDFNCTRAAILTKYCSDKHHLVLTELRCYFNAGITPPQRITSTAVYQIEGQPVEDVGVFYYMIDVDGAQGVYARYTNDIVLAGAGGEEDISVEERCSEGEGTMQTLSNITATLTLTATF